MIKDSVQSPARYWRACTVALLALATIAGACRSESSDGSRGTANTGPESMAGPSVSTTTGANSASRIVVWALTEKEILSLDDAALDEWKRRGVSGFVVGAQSLRGMGGDQDFTGDPSADLSGDNYRLQRVLRDSRFVSRARARGIDIYFRFYFVNLDNTATPLKDWFDDEGWSGVVIPRVREVAAAARSLGMSGLGFDQELYPQRGDVKTASWAWSYPGNSRPENETRAKANERGKEMMTAISTVFPDPELLAYNTQFPENWESLVHETTSGAKDAFYSNLQIDFWDGMAGVHGYRSIRFLDPIFYKVTQISGATWDTALQYNANRVYAYLSRTWSSWSYSASRVYVMPFLWLDAGTTTFEAARHPDYVREQMMAFRKWSPGDMLAVYAYSFGTFDYRPYVPVLQQVATPAKVDDEPPGVKITGNERSGTGLKVTGTATDNLAIRQVRWRTSSGAEGTAALHWKVTDGDYRTQWSWRMDWSATIPDAGSGDVVTITVEDIKGLTTAAELAR